MKGCVGCLGIIVFSGVLVFAATHIWRAANPEEAAQEDARMAKIDREAAAHREFLAKHPEAGHEGEICREMQREVEARLKAPATADFPSCAWTAASHVTYAGDGRYNFSSWVDAQNGFGANIRTYYDGEALVDAQSLTTHTFRWTRFNIDSEPIIAESTSRAASPAPQPAQEDFVVGHDIPFPAIIAKTPVGRRDAICGIVQGMVGRKLKAPATAKFQDCLPDEESPVQDAGDGRYTISSWVDIDQVRTNYDGEAVIAEEDGEPRTIRITRLETH
ncbi:MAG: hypothetical protein WBY44_37385 [Bryobacteraceae bacterium]